jgi:site-specific DNA-methyltransferase (adenine-specific)
MNRIEDKSIDMIFCDLPYGTTACAWDSVIPFEPLWNHYKRIIKDDGAIILTASQPFTTKLINSNIENFKEEIIWLKNKSGNGLQANQKHIKVHENILVFSYSGKYKFNPQKWGVEEKEFLTQRKTLSMYGEGNNIYGSMPMQRKLDDGTRNPISVVAYRVPHNPSKTKTYSKDVDIRLHETQKPLLLLEYLVESFSNEGDLVLDNCFGSGTTMIACINKNRNFIGFELQEEYYKLAKERINKHILSKNLQDTYKLIA